MSMLKSTARRTAIACGYSGDGVGTILPSTFARFARMVGSSAQGTQLPPSLEEVCEALHAGDPAYHADAVHFDGSTWLEIASLTAAASQFFSMSVWMKADTFASDPELWASDPDGNNITYFFMGSDGVIDCNLSDAIGNKNIHAQTNIPVTEDAWHHLLISVDTDFQAGGTKRVKVYLDDVDVTLSSGSNVFNIALGAVPFFFGGDGGGGADEFTGDCAIAWIALGQSLLDGAAVIPEATRRKFIDASGKPVFLGADGLLPTGVAPTIFFDGDATGFVTNKGTGGAFTLTGSLTNASTSPSD